MKLTTAPTSVRPRASASASAPGSKSSPWTRTVATLSTARHRRKERHFLRPDDRGVAADVNPIERRANSRRLAERTRVALATLREPGDKVANRRHGRRRIKLFLIHTDPFAHPGEIKRLHSRFSRRRHGHS